MDPRRRFHRNFSGNAGRPPWTASATQEGSVSSIACARVWPFQANGLVDALAVGCRAIDGNAACSVSSDSGRASQSVQHLCAVASRGKPTRTAAERLRTRTDTSQKSEVSGLTCGKSMLLRRAYCYSSGFTFSASRDAIMSCSSHVVQWSVERGVRREAERGLRRRALFSQSHTSKSLQKRECV